MELKWQKKKSFFLQIMLFWNFCDFLLCMKHSDFLETNNFNDKIHAKIDKI